MKNYKALVLGGMLAGSLVASAAPAFAQSREFVNQREVRMDRQVLDRDYDQLLQDREILDRHLRYGAGPRQIARDREMIRDDEAKIRRDEAELRRDQRELAENYRPWRRY